MNTQDGNAGILLPNVLVLLLVGWGIFRTSEPLESYRPPVSNQPMARVGPLQPIVARSWEDPFEAVAGAEWTKDPFWNVVVDLPSRGREKEPTAEPRANPTPHRPTPHRLPLDEIGEYAPSIDGRAILPIQKHFRFFHQDLGPKGPDDGGNRGLVLLVTLPGGGFAMEHEKRHRIRYAVMAGLANAGYAPIEQGRLGASYYVPRFGDAEQSAKPELFLHERFRPVSHLQEWREKRYLEILVVYLNEDYLTRPQVGNFAQLTGRLPWPQSRTEEAPAAFRTTPGRSAAAPGDSLLRKAGKNLARRAYDLPILRYFIPDAPTLSHLGSSSESREASPLGAIAALVNKLRFEHGIFCEDGGKKGAAVEFQVVGPTNSDLLVHMIGEALLVESLDLKGDLDNQPRKRVGVFDLDQRALDDKEYRKGRLRNDQTDGFRPPRILTTFPTISDRQLGILAGNWVKSKIGLLSLENDLLDQADLEAARPTYPPGSTTAEREKIRKAAESNRRKMRDLAVQKLVAAAYDGLRPRDPARFQFLCGLQLERISPDDGLLTRALVAELRNRNVHPEKGKDRILLVTEFETKYARAIVQSFRTAALDPDGTKFLGEYVGTRRNAIDIGHEQIIQQVSYLRGLDGSRGKDQRISREDEAVGVDDKKSSWRLSGGLTEGTT
ncbi:MAG: hypothetical protein HKN82_14340, partial [Akkermansiaceae bacterium]|nr:hypothetical protein [Akkermansiaceae bacterium]